VRWLQSNYWLILSIAIPFLVGGYYWGKSVEDDYRTRPAIDQAEIKWSLVEAYGGGAIVFGSMGALFYYLAIAIVKKG
jgi:hypothetical protein